MIPKPVNSINNKSKNYVSLKERVKKVLALRKITYIDISKEIYFSATTITMCLNSGASQDCRQAIERWLEINENNR